MSYGTIYAVKNTVNSKIYVGQTVRDLKERFTAHRNSKECTHLARAMEKYGSDKFYIEELCKANSKEELDLLEIEYITRFDSISNGYNLRSGGSRGKCTLSTKALMSAGQLRNWNDPVIRAKHIDGYAKAWQSESRRKHISALTIGEKNPFFGQRHTEDTKAKISATRKKKPVLQIDLNGAVINEFESIEAAGRAVGAFSNNIRRSCKTSGALCAGYRWAFKEVNL